MAVPEWDYEFYERLRTAIVTVAVSDYKAAIRKSKRKWQKCKEEQAMENFFLSDWGQLLTGDNGEYIIERCRKDFRWVKSPKGRMKLTEEKQRELTAEYLNGASRVELSKKYGISEQSVYACVRRWF